MMATSPVESLSSGFILNIELFFITLLLALPLGLVITFCSMSKFKPLKWLSRTFVWIIRGTPLMLQLFVVLYVPGLLFAMPISSRFTAAVIAFVINYAAYFSEIYRGGIESVSRGQYEAGQVLGMTKTQIFFKIILLQVIKRIIPPLSNEVITLTKDTSLARVIALAEIIMCAERYTKQGLYVMIALRQLFYLEPFTLDAALENGEHRSFENVLFAVAMNFSYEGGGFCFCPEADGTDDLLDVMVVSNLAKWKVSYLLPMALFGRHTGFPEVHMERCSSLSFQTDRAEPVHLDGESGGHRTEERIGLETERLRLLGDWVKEGMER